MTQIMELENNAYQLRVTLADKDVVVQLFDKAMQFELVNNPYLYRAVRKGEEGSIHAEWLLDADLQGDTEHIVIRGKLAGLDVKHIFSLPQARPLFQEHITLSNPTAQ